MDIRRFRHFCEQHFHLKENARKLSDGRPRIRPASIFHACSIWGVCWAWTNSFAHLEGCTPCLGQSMPQAVRWVDLVLLDGLYVAQGFLRVCLEECHVDYPGSRPGHHDAMGLLRKYGVYSHDLHAAEALALILLSQVGREGVEVFFGRKGGKAGECSPFQVPSGWSAGCPKKMPKKDVMGNF